MRNASELVKTARELAEEAGRLHCSSPATHVSNALDYQWAAHALYLNSVPSMRLCDRTTTAS